MRPLVPPKRRPPGMRPPPTYTQQRKETEEVFRRRVANLERPLTADEIDDASSSPLGFGRVFWDCVNPGQAAKFVNGYHLGCLSEHFVEMFRPGSTLNNLGVFFPIRTGKSLFTNVFMPSWRWLKAPETSGIFASHSASLGNRDSIFMRDIVQSPRYQSLTSKCRLKEDQNTIRRFTNIRQGMRLTINVLQGLGEGGDILAVDDTISPENARHQSRREKVIYWWNTVFRHRTGANPANTKRIVSQQRLDEGDLPGHLMSHEFDEWEFLILPMEYEPKRFYFPTPGQKIDPAKLPKDWIIPTKLQQERPELMDGPTGSGRVKRGDLLWPQQLDAHQVAVMKRTQGRMAAAQLQQRPQAETGSIFHMDTIRRYQAEWWPDGRLKAIVLLPKHGAGGKHAMPRTVDAGEWRWFQTMDTAQTAKTWSDSTAVGTFGLSSRGDLIVWNMFAEILEVPEQYVTIQALRQGPVLWIPGMAPVVQAPWPFALIARYCEAKSSGYTIIQQSIIDGTPVLPLPITRKDKVEKAAFATGLYASGMVYHPEPGPQWLEDFEEEMRLFPNGNHDDRVDVLSYGAMMSGQDALLRSHVKRSVVLGAANDLSTGTTPDLEDVIDKLMPDATLEEVDEAAKKNQHVEGVELEPGVTHYTDETSLRLGETRMPMKSPKLNN